MNVKSVSTESKVLGLSFSSCVMNASGALCTSFEELRSLDESYAGAIVSKSCSQMEREGNPKPRYFHNQDLSLNSMGLPNNGYSYYILSSQKLNRKPFIMSVAALDKIITYQILEVILQESTVSMVELNVSCPNLCHSNQVLGNHFEDLDNYFSVMSPLFQKYKMIGKPYGVKLPPYWEGYQFDVVSKLIQKYQFDFVTTLNSVPNCLVIDTETESPVIIPKNGIGGLGGKFVKPVTLSNIYQLRCRLPDVVIIGCGGIETGEDVFHHLLAGASLVQVGTELMKRGPSVFAKIESELKDIMIRKGYHHIGEFIGKMKLNVVNPMTY